MSNAIATKREFCREHFKRFPMITSYTNMLLPESQSLQFILRGALNDSEHFGEKL